MSAPDMQYALDTARAKTPAERLRIVADLMEAQERGAKAYYVDADGSLSLANVSPVYATISDRIVTKRRPALVIPALELFEGPMKATPERGAPYFTPDLRQEAGYLPLLWDGVDIERKWLAAGLCFATQEAAARIGLHIRNELAKAVAR